MKRLLLLGLIALAGCLPALNDPAVQRIQVTPPWTHGYTTEARGVFVAASSTRIEAVEGPNCQLRNTLVSGLNSAVSCDAPGTYKIQTTGTVSVGVVR